MTKRIEEIKEGDKFTKGDWTFSVMSIERRNVDGLIVLVNLLENRNHRMWLTKAQAEAIDTWIEDTSISQAAADAIVKKIDVVDDWHGTDAWHETRTFIQSLVKK